NLAQKGKADSRSPGRYLAGHEPPHDVNRRHEAVRGLLNFGPENASRPCLFGQDCPPWNDLFMAYSETTSVLNASFLRCTAFHVIATSKLPTDLSKTREPVSG